MNPKNLMHGYPFKISHIIDNQVLKSEAGS